MEIIILGIKELIYYKYITLRQIIIFMLINIKSKVLILTDLY